MAQVGDSTNARRRRGRADGTRRGGNPVRQVSADDVGGAYPFDLTGGGARLLVDEADAEEAAAILSERPDS